MSAVRQPPLPPAGLAGPGAAAPELKPRLLQRPGKKSGEDWPGYTAFRERPYPLNIEITLNDPPNSQPSDRLFSATPPG